MRFKAGDKVYCKSMDSDLVIARPEGEFGYICINTLHCLPSATRFDTYVLSAHDLESGWRIHTK